MKLFQSVHSDKGFSLLETMIVLAVISVALCLGVFAFHPVKESYQKRFFISQLQSDLYHAHSYAINQKKRVTLSFPKNQTRYSATDESNKEIFSRTLPEWMKIAGDGTLTSFHITSDGNISNFGRVYFLLNDKRIELTVFIGRGRFIVKE